MTTAASPAGALDINAETHPFGVVQRLLDEVALLHFYAEPESPGPVGLTLPAEPGVVVGFDVRSALRRFDVGMSFEPGGAPRADNRVGARLGTLRERWMLIPGDYWALPDAEPPPVPFDPSRSQRFVVLDSRHDLGDGDEIQSFGTGVTRPGTHGVEVGVVSTLWSGRGRFAQRIGTCTYLGRLDPERGFHGSVLWRIPDTGGELHTDREPPPGDGEPLPERGVTYVVLQGHKPTDHHQTEILKTPDGRPRGLRVIQTLRGMEAVAAEDGAGGVRSYLRPGAPVGEMTSDIAFDFANPGAPGTDLSPIPFSAYNHIRFAGRDGEPGVRIDNKGEEGRTFNLELAGPSGPRGLRFGGFGPLLGGTGALTGTTGQLADNSMVGIAPHATSTFYVLRLEEATASSDRHRPAPTAPDPFLPVLDRMESYRHHYLSWREGFRRCAGPIARAFTREFNQRLEAGEFPGLALDPAVLEQAFRRDAFPFDPIRFERYRGRAEGTFRTYGLEAQPGGHREVMPAAVLYSTWAPETDQRGERRFKRITGSFQRYFRADPGTDAGGGEVDLLVNSHHPETGVTSFVSIHQHRRQERASFAYPLPGAHEVLWIVKDVERPGGAPTDDGVFMASHEWKGVHEGRTAYFMVGIHFRVDFDTCLVELSGDTFWRALYLEAPEPFAGSQGTASKGVLTS